MNAQPVMNIGSNMAIGALVASPFGRRVVVLATHLALWSAGYVGAFLLRYDGTIPTSHRREAWLGLLVLLALRSIAFWRAGLFHGLLRYSGIPEVRSIIQASTLASVAFLGAGVAIRPLLQPRSVYVGELVLSVLLAAGLRLAIRMLREGQSASDHELPPAILVGAGDAGEGFMRDLERSRRPALRIVSILDDDPRKHGSVLRGVTVVGPCTEEMLRRESTKSEAKNVVLAIPTAGGGRVREVVNTCQALNLAVKTLPSLEQLLDDNVRVSMLRDVVIEDLLRREPIVLDERSIGQLLHGKRVMVTGGAGSIGSELARQAARYEPSSLTLLDHNENGLFELEHELREAFPRLSLRLRVADIKDATRMEQVIRTESPHLILHAAAHKHVPLMEENPPEAIKNNVFGTRIVADLAEAYGVEAFILISTDKAVNPSSVMGASKRVAEMYVQAMSQKGRTRFAAVRFGNVLGSAGSVVPTFRRQIAKGGPVTVTHPEMERYFMTIPEASQLVLQSGALSKGGELFLLDMGAPVRIVDLARDMIRMSGLQPDVDILIEYSGLRPGEKLSEELFHADEPYARTLHEKIFVCPMRAVTLEVIREHLDRLRDSLPGDRDSIRRELEVVVPEAKLSRAEGPRPQVEGVIKSLSSFDTIGAR